MDYLGNTPGEGCNGDSTGVLASKDGGSTKSVMPDHSMAQMPLDPLNNKA